MLSGDALTQRFPGASFFKEMHARSVILMRGNCLLLLHFYSGLSAGIVANIALLLRIFISSMKISLGGDSSLMKSQLLSRTDLFWKLGIEADAASVVSITMLPLAYLYRRSLSIATHFKGDWLPRDDLRSVCIFLAWTLIILNQNAGRAVLARRPFLQKCVAVERPPIYRRRRHGDR